eukprot:g6556.t1
MEAVKGFPPTEQTCKVCGAGL